MQLIQQIAFIILAGVSIFLFAKKVGEIRRNILLGRDEDLNDNPGQRWKNMTLLALGQQKMFKKPLPAFLHLAVYAGFIIINIEILEILLDGVLGHHRLFAAPLGSLYAVLIGFFEILAVLVLVSCLIFLGRRNITKVRRLNLKELNGWPRNDANIILITEVILMSLFLTMNTADLVLQSRGAEHYTITSQFWITSNFTGMFENLSNETLIGIERTGWWLHIIGVLIFMNYLPYSKHFHIILAFPNAYYMRLKPQGEMKNMKEIQNEVLYMMQPELAPAAPTDGSQPVQQRFGAKDIMDLSWKNLLDAYSCTECGRCTAACPANLTGKALSPRKIMMDTRDRLEEVGENINKNKTFQDDGKSLVHDYITVEELRACTTCQACVEACPVGIEPLDIIQQLRRYLVMEESNSPQEWNLMFGNVENNMAPWKFSPDERDKWAEELNAQA
ncbi:(Fe-S)-binding protein [Polluticoccus soli]|uniref:(Fe-S)-binding protein n=1 Tax=Polluticoccus soli TaxID=3034150 RepID=UPI0023E137D7|nr:(Fe-S)-binding protein [Flavipsychrobacter sp. JY13-12]